MPKSGVPLTTLSDNARRFPRQARRRWPQLDLGFSFKMMCTCSGGVPIWLKASVIPLTSFFFCSAVLPCHISIITTGILSSNNTLTAFSSPALRLTCQPPHYSSSHRKRRHHSQERYERGYDTSSSGKAPRSFPGKVRK